MRWFFATNAASAGGGKKDHGLSVVQADNAFLPHRHHSQLANPASWGKGFGKVPLKRPGLVSVSR